MFLRCGANPSRLSVVSPVTRTNVERSSQGNLMKIYALALTLIASAATNQIVFAQEAPAGSVALKEHQWLTKFVGNWDVVSEGTTGEGEPPIRGKAVMKSSMLGKLWIVNASDTEIAGTRMKSIQMIGYDPTKKKYVGIWADSIINHMWHYEGHVDESGKKIVLDAEGPSMQGDGTLAKYRDAFEFKDDDTIIATSSMLGPDNQWIVIMSGTATRRK